MKAKIYSLICAISIGLTFPLAASGETSFMRSRSQKAVGVSTDVAIISLPVATLAGVLISHDWEGLKEGAITAATTAAATLILKYSIKEMRPDFSNTHSFPSGHTAVSFATATFLQKRYGWRFGVPAYAVAGYVAWGRVFARKHHWWDALGGALIGAGCAYVFTTPWAKEHELTIVPAASNDAVGLAASLSF